LRPGVVDASALLALYFGEPAAEAVGRIVAGSLVSSVNYSEVIGKALDRGEAFNATLRKLVAMDFIVIAHDEGLARRTGELQPVTKRLSLSLGDRACLALAERETLPAYTLDRSWTRLDLPIEVVLLG
jgi:PIN domain nuclease of toxin-antitoxin system